MVRRKFISVRVLESGMVIDQAIMDRSGRILIARKTVLDDFLIDALQKMKISGVYIREGEEEEQEQVEIAPETLQVIERNRVEDKRKVTLSESVRERVSQGVQYLYNDVAAPDFTQMAQEVTVNLMDAISENDAVAMNVDALKVSDEYTFKHSVDVATIAMLIAKQSGMTERDVYHVGITGLLHDVGKSEIPKDVLNKAGKLDEQEFEFMKQHTLLGYRILKEKNDIGREIMLGVLQHHEKLNGKGYPQGLKEKEISPYAKIIAIADIYDALVTERVYKKAFSQQDAIEMIMAMTDELDVEYMRDFLDIVILYPVDSVVMLSNGEPAKVVKNTPHYPLRPTVVGLKSGKVYDLSGDIKCASIIIE